MTVRCLSCYTIIPMSKPLDGFIDKNDCPFCSKKENEVKCKSCGENAFDCNCSAWNPIPVNTQVTKDQKVTEMPNVPDIINAAIRGTRGDDQKRIAEIGIDFLVTLLNKNNDYGSSVWKVPIVAPKTDVASAILVRMSDKIERIQSLQQRQSEVTSESFDDTIKDLGAYCLLYLARPKKDIS